jgi:hypothetical protein
MKSFQEMKLFPPRFRTYEDAMLYHECLNTGAEFPKEKWVWPFMRTLNGDISINPQYRDAPYECALIEHPSIKEQNQ